MARACAMRRHLMHMHSHQLTHVLQPQPQVFGTHTCPHTPHSPGCLRVNTKSMQVRVKPLTCSQCSPTKMGLSATWKSLLGRLNMLTRWSRSGSSQIA